VRLAVMRLPGSCGDSAPDEVPDAQVRPPRSGAGPARSADPGALAEQENVQPPTMTSWVAGLEARRPGEHCTASERRSAEIGRRHARRARHAGGRPQRPRCWLALRMGDLTPAEVATCGPRAKWLGKARAGRPVSPHVLLPAGAELPALRRRDARVNTGTWMQRVAQDWLVLQLSHGDGTSSASPPRCSSCRCACSVCSAVCSRTVTPSAGCCSAPTPSSAWSG